MEYLKTSRITIPRVGLGTWDIRGSSGKEAIENAIKSGYRLIDTASYYENEEIVGEAVNNSVNNGIVRRDELFITTKIWPNEFSNPEKAIKRSMSKLNLEYVDLYLVHWPESSLELRTKAYLGLEKASLDGITKHIGVSNYSIVQIEELLVRSSIPPTVNQIHVSPYRYPRSVIEYCQANEIAVQAYTPLEHGKKSDNRLIVEIAEHHSKTPEQVMLRWAVDKGMIPIPKSSNEHRQRINLDIFDFTLSQDEIGRLDTLP